MLTDTEIMAQVRAAFQEEQAEHRQAIGELLLELERDPNHPKRQVLLDQLFREAHSLKGGARAAGQPAVEQIAHRIEDVMSQVRRGTLQLTHEVCDPIYVALDAIGTLMDEVPNNEPANLASYTPLLEILSGVAQSANEASPASTSSLPSSDNGNHTADDQRTLDNQQTSDEHLPSSEASPLTTDTTIRIGTALLDTLLNETGELMTCSLRSAQHVRHVHHLTELIGRWRHVWRQASPIYSRLQERRRVIRPTVHYLSDRDELPAVATESRRDSETAALLDALKEASSLIATLEQQVAQHGQQVAEATSQLGAIVERMHTQVRRARMLPLTTIFGQVRLQAREMARTAGKQVVFDVDDGDAIADRTVLERLRDVIVHLVRNAVDHGIESPAVRLSCGKAPEGRITLQARVSGDRLALTLADDGAGLDLEAIRRQALAGGVVSESDLAHMGESDLMQLIFLPGFSTKETVSTLSGRGVGLDIVQSHVERMHGRIDVQSQSGQGCRFSISVPLSLMNTHSLLLRVGTRSYAIPLDAVQRIVQVAPHDMQTLGGRAALVLDGHPLRLVRLDDLLGSVSPNAGRLDTVPRLALVLGSGERQSAIFVDDVLAEQELVTHRLPSPLQHVRFVAGASVLADGSVVPILDAVDLVEAAIGAQDTIDLTLEPAKPQRSPTVLVVDDSLTTRTLEKNILEAAGFQVRLATDGAEALDLLDQLPDDAGCDLLLSDVDMPRLNGFELTAQIRAIARFKHLPIVLVTSLDTPADRERGIAAGADAYIVKRTFEQQALLETIAQLI
jgi:two-component system, chemotaxis family, sensor kinase CheA